MPLPWVTVSERGDFQRCRRMWKYTSPNLWSITPKGAPATQFHTGSAVHEAMAAQAMGHDPHKHLSEWCDKEVEDFVKDYTETTGFSPSEQDVFRLQQNSTLAKSLVSHYFEHYGMEDTYNGHDPVVAELSFRVPIPGTCTKPEHDFGAKCPPKAKDCTPGMLAGTGDLFLQHRETGGLWICDHKTFSSKPSFEDVEYNDQFTAYSWAFSILTGERVEGYLYNGIAKTLPQKPRVLASGKGISKAAISTTHELYLSAITENGFDPADYEDILNRLKKQNLDPESSPFFTRWKVPVSNGALRSFEKQLTLMYRDMARAEHEQIFYPNFRWDGCWDCGFRQLCKTEQLGEDPEWIKENCYVQHSYGTAQAMGVPVVEVGSVEDIRRFGKRHPSERIVVVPRGDK